MTTSFHTVTSKAEIIYRGDCIIENIIKENVLLEKEDILEIKKVNLAIAGGKKYAVLVSGRLFSAISKEAREVSASKEFANDTIAKAIIINSLAQKLVARFYIKFNKPYIKTNAFTNREDALTWLKHQLAEKKEEPI